MKVVKQIEQPLAKRKRFTKQELQLYSMCILPVLWIIIFKYLPLGGIIIAFKDYRYDLGIFGSEWVGFKNFEFFFTSSDFFRITRNTLVMNCLFITFLTCSSVIVATLLFHITKRAATKTFQTIMITPHFISWVVAAYMLYGFLSPQNGLLNVILEKLGMESVDWYAKPEAWPPILTISYIWKAVGMDCVIYYAALMGIDSTLFEAADIDGAGAIQKFTKIIVPELTSLIVIQTIVRIGSIFNSDFGLFYQLPRNVGMLYSTTDVIDTYVFRAMRVVGDMSMASAIGLLQSVVGFILVILTNYITNKITPENALF